MKSKSFFVLLGVLALAVIAFGLISAPRDTLNVLAPACAVSAALFIAANASRRIRRRDLTPAINTLPDNVGTSKNVRRYLATAAITTRNLLGKIGADEDHIAALSAASDEPIGVITDEPAAAEDPTSVELLGVTNRTLPMVASEAIDEGENVYAAAGGKVQDKPTSAGTYWKVGKAATPAGADGDPIEVIPCTPRKLIVIAALTSTNGTAAAATADLPGLAAEAEKIGDDLRAIANALNGDADVALATT